jgi:hypothetical protein
MVHENPQGLRSYYSSAQIKKNEIGRTHSIYGGEERRINGFWLGNVKEGDHLEDVGVDWRIILKWI